MSNNSNGEFITIKEASILTGKSDTTLYRYIKGGKIICHTLTLDGKQITKVSKKDLASIFNINGRQILTIENHMNHSEEHVSHSEKHMNHDENHMNHSEEHVSHSENQIEDIINKVLYNHQNQLMKPIEQQALYRLGKVEQENEFLKQQIETLLEENSIIRDQMKALPAPIDEITAKLKFQEDTIQAIQKQKDEEILKLQSEKDEAIKKLQDELQTIQDQSEKEKMEIALSWQKELELAKRPWWKKMFG